MLTIMSTNIKKQFKLKSNMLSGLFSLFALSTASISMAKAESVQSSQLNEGKKLYENTCAGCHGKTLTGGAGFNLKDEEWIHGSSASEILNNVKSGFPNAGMPGFAGVYNEQQLKNIVNYVLSKREGLTDLSYKIYHLDNNADQNFEIIKTLDVAKSGKIRTNVMDLDMPEVANYIIEFEGFLHTPTDKKTKLFAMLKSEMIEIEIDGEKVAPLQKKWNAWAWPLKQGKHHFKLRYSTANQKQKGNRQLKFFVADDNLQAKLFAISSPAKKFLKQATVIIQPTANEAVVRKKIVKLPAYSVAVGSPLKMNYAFNTKSCAITGVWSGDFINIGPNIEGRGRDGSLIMGKWAFHYPQVLKPVAESEQPNKTACQFIKYNRQGHTNFHYSLDGQTISMQGVAINDQQLVLTYSLIAGENKKMAFALPKSDDLTINSDDGIIDNNQYIIDAKVGHSYQITITIAETK